MKKLNFKNTIFIIIFSILFGCGVSVPKLNEIIGIYYGKYQNATESLEINADGTFYQELIIDGQIFFKNSGKWSIDGYNISLESFYEYFDLQLKVVRKEPVLCHSYCQWYSPDLLIFDEDAGYALQRKKINLK